MTAKLDLAVVDRNANTVSLLHGDGSGGFTPMSGSPIATNSQPFSVILRRAQGHVLAVGDLNGDGKPDLVAVDQFGNAISTFLNMFTYPPAAPTAVNAVAGDGQASVSFGIPARDGGAAVTSYQVTASPGGATATGSGSPAHGDRTDERDRVHLHHHSDELGGDGRRIPGLEPGDPERACGSANGYVRPLGPRHEASHEPERLDGAAQRPDARADLDARK